MMEKKYIDVDRWHREAEKHAVRDGISLAVAFLLAYLLLLGVGYSLAFTGMPKAEGREFIGAVKEPKFDPPVEEKAKAKLTVIPKIVDEPEEAAEEPAIETYAVEEPVPSYSEPVYAETQQEVPTFSGTPENFKQAGVVYGDDGTRYTWYSQNVLPGGGLDIPGRHVDENGYVADSNGRIAVASSDLPIGTELDTPFGPATVYDTGCASGTVDIYTNF